MRKVHFPLVVLLALVMVCFAGSPETGASPGAAGISPPAPAFSPVAPSDDYMVIVERSAVMPADVAAGDWLSRWTPTLAGYKADGRLVDFHAIPGMGAIVLRAPSPDLLATMETWPGIEQIIPASAADPAVLQHRADRLSDRRRAASPERMAPDRADSINGLTYFAMHLGSTEVDGYVDTADVPITLTLKSGTVVKSQVETVASGIYFRAYFTSIIEGNDTIEVEMPGSPLTIVTVADLSLSPDKAADVIYGTAPSNSSVEVQLWSSAHEQWHTMSTTTDGSGNFAADFNAHPDDPDVWMGDWLYLNHWNSNGFKTYLGGFRVPGFYAVPSSDYIYGYAAPSSTVNLEILDNSGASKGTATRSADTTGYYYVSFAGLVDIVVGDQVQVQVGADPVQMLDIVDVQLTSIEAVTNIVQGTAPPDSKIEVYASDSYLAADAVLTVQTNADGVYNADLSGLLDIRPGSYALATYHDAQDNEVGGAYLYAGPFVKVYLNTYYDVWVVGLPSEAVNVTLRNALDVIKGTAAGVTNTGGSVSLRLLDSLGNDVNPVAGDSVEVEFASGITRTVDVVGIEYIADRDTRTVYGTGPANADLRLIYSNGDQVADVVTDSSGHYSHTFSGRLTGGYSLRVLCRNAQGDDIEIYGYIPQFTVQTVSGYISGYGPPRSAVVASLLDSGLTVKDTRTAMTSDNGYYYLYFSSAIVPGDTVVVDVGPLHYEQIVVALTIAADPVNNIVYGTAPPDAWLNVYDQSSFGPYTWYNYEYFHADALGNYAAYFGHVGANDYLNVIYWEDGYRDRVSVTQYVAGVWLNHVLDRIGGHTTSDAVGTVTVRNSDGALKTSETVTATSPYGSFSTVLDGVDLLAGDEVTVQIGVVDQTSDVIPLDAALNHAADLVSGTSLPDLELGAAIYHWSGTGFSYYASGINTAQFVSTDASGAFALDYSGVIDLQLGDYVTLYYIDDLDTQQSATFYTTSPTVTVDSYPTVVQPNGPVDVLVSVADGVHVQSVYVRWDTESHADDNLYGYWSSRQQASIGQNLVSFSAPSGGTIYFKAYASVDGQAIWSSGEHTIDVTPLLATTLYDPVSGTTNDSTPTIYGVAPPGASVALYEGATLLITDTASETGDFGLDLPASLAPGQHTLHAVSTVDGDVGPESNPVMLTVDPTLPVDPVHILVTTRGLTQHLRDENGYANLGGRIWTRTGDVVNMSIPISSTNVYTASLYVGGVFATTMLDSGDGIYVGAYTPPTSGSYSVDLRFQLNGPTDPVTTINILTGLIDPDGYVYQEDLGIDHRVAGATVTCYELADTESDVWIPWNASIWGQTNPQTVGADGYYAFFTLPGNYKVVVTAPGYWTYESPVLTVVDEPVHHNVPLRLVRTIHIPLVVR